MCFVHQCWAFMFLFHKVLTLTDQDHEPEGSETSRDCCVLASSHNKLRSGLCGEGRPPPGVHDESRSNMFVDSQEAAPLFSNRHAALRLTCDVERRGRGQDEESVSSSTCSVISDDKAVQSVILVMNDVAGCVNMCCVFY